MGKYNYRRSSARKHQDFKDLSKEITLNIKFISQNINLMQQMLSKILVNDDSLQARRELCPIENCTQKLIKITYEDLINLSKIYFTFYEEDKKLRKIQFELLIKEFTAYVKVFQNLQRKLIRNDKQMSKNFKNGYFQEDEGQLKRNIKETNHINEQLCGIILVYYKGEQNNTYANVDEEKQSHFQNVQQTHSEIKSKYGIKWKIAMFVLLCFVIFNLVWMAIKIWRRKKYLACHIFYVSPPAYVSR